MASGGGVVAASGAQRMAKKRDYRQRFSGAAYGRYQHNNRMARAAEEEK